MRARSGAALREVQGLLRRGDLDGAIARYVALVDAHPDDWTSVNALGDLYVRTGDLARANAQFTCAADHFHAEGFLSKAAALYRKILKRGHDDRALLNLTDIAAQQGLLAEARQCLVTLEQRRRAEGNTRGADECLVSLEALVRALHDPLPPVAIQADVPADGPPAAGGTDAPAGADADAEPVAVLADDPAGQDVAVIDADAPAVPLPAPEPSNDVAAAVPASQPLALQSIFDRLRETAEREADVAEAVGRFDRAQQRLAEGDDAEAIADLQGAAHAPLMRFRAASALGRLYVSRGALHAGIAWLDRAAAVPPTSPEEASAVLYDLADALERAGETERALVTFMKLDVHMGTYRESRARIARLLQAREGTEDT